MPQVPPVMERVSGFVSWLTNGYWQILPADTVDDLYSEIYKLEKTLANAPTRPMKTRPIKVLEPVTEQQKIMDMAG
jgi:predicted glycosyl hydrolase (DUF1957 family)